MSKLLRITQKIFGSNPGVNQVAQIGSFAAATPLFTTNLTTIQALSNYLTGWLGCVDGANSPTIEDMNALDYLITAQLAYLMQAGIAEYDSGTTYYIGSMVNSSGTIYVSKTDANVGNALTSTTNWKVQGKGSRTVTGTDTATASDEIIRADATAASFVETLPTIASTPGKIIIIKCINTNANTVTPTGNGAELIDGANAYQPLNSYESANFFNNGTSWDVL